MKLTNWVIVMLVICLTVIISYYVATVGVKALDCIYNVHELKCILGMK